MLNTNLTCICEHIYTCVHSNMHMNLHVCLYVHGCIYMCVYICINTHTHIYIYIYKYIYIYIHIYIYITCCIKCFQFCIFKSIYFFYFIRLFCFFVILRALNLLVFVKYYCIQKSKLKFEMGFAMFHNDH